MSAELKMGASQPVTVTVHEGDLADQSHSKRRTGQHAQIAAMHMTQNSRTDIALYIRNKSTR